jgi:hypothetical protein
MASSQVESLCSAYCSSVRMTQLERLLSAEPVVMVAVLSHTLAVAAGRVVLWPGPTSHITILFWIGAIKTDDHMFLCHIVVKLVQYIFWTLFSSHPWTVMSLR